MVVHTYLPTGEVLRVKVECESGRGEEGRGGGGGACTGVEGQSGLLLCYVMVMLLTFRLLLL